MIGKINVSQIITDHVCTLTDQNTKKTSKSDCVLFFGLPILIAAVLVGLKLVFGKAISGVLITSLAIFAGLLFNLLLLIFDIANKPRPAQAPLSPIKIQLLREIYNNIAYAILIALLTIVLSLIHFGLVALNLKPEAYATAFSIYACTGNFVLTLLMVLKRMHKLLREEFPRSP
jgi:hypothetical protein